MDWMTTFILLGFAYIYLHYVFATASGHVAAMYVPFAAVAIGAGAPPLMVAVCFAIFSNFMWGITEYAGGPGPIYFGQGFFERPRFYKINFVLVTASVIIVFAVGMLWWKIIGLYDQCCQHVPADFRVYSGPIPFKSIFVRLFLRDKKRPAIRPFFYFYIFLKFSK